MIEHVCSQLERGESDDEHVVKYLVKSRAVAYVLKKTGQAHLKHLVWSTKHVVHEGSHRL